MEMWENIRSKRKEHGASPREGLVADLDTDLGHNYM